jgi:Topoisomerase 6 subunit A/Spo11, Toprim domain
MQENRELTIGWRVHFKPRGNLTEPHTRRQVPLGTAEVIRYRVSWTNGIDPDPIYTLPPWAADTAGPHNRFGAVIVVEKEGIADLLIEDGVGDRFDVAIVGNEGQSVEAELKLADGLDLPVFILHDFDRTGLTIAANLRDGTWRHRYRNSFPVVDVGLRLEQIDGLETEAIDANNLKSVTDNRLRECGATEAEIGFLRSRRVELNALTTEQLVNIVETALLDRGVEKIIPTEDELANAWRAAKARAEILEAIDRANKDAESWLQVDAPPDLAQRVRALLAQNPSLSWDVALRRIAIGERRH